MMRFLAPEDSGTQWKSVGYGGAISPDGKWLAYESRNLDALKYTYANFRQVQASGRFHHRAESSRDGPETGASYFFAAASSQA